MVIGPNQVQRSWGFGKKRRKKWKQSNQFMIMRTRSLQFSYQSLWDFIVGGAVAGIILFRDVGNLRLSSFERSPSKAEGGSLFPCCHDVIFNCLVNYSFFYFKNLIPYSVQRRRICLIARGWSEQGRTCTEDLSLQVSFLCH